MILGVMYLGIRKERERERELDDAKARELTVLEIVYQPSRIMALGWS